VKIGDRLKELLCGEVRKLTLEASECLRAGDEFLLAGNAVLCDSSLAKIVNAPIRADAVAIEAFAVSGLYNAESATLDVSAELCRLIADEFCDSTDVFHYLVGAGENMVIDSLKDISFFAFAYGKESVIDMSVSIGLAVFYFSYACKSGKRFMLF
jgi:hypothetical protein